MTSTCMLTMYVVFPLLSRIPETGTPCWNNRGIHRSTFLKSPMSARSSTSMTVSCPFSSRQLTKTRAKSTSRP